MKKYVCIHGHFYQPPRENAWLEAIEWQESAVPFHDWNERINYECYAPNTASRILDEDEVIKDITNNYARISFNFGPTLIGWLREHAAETYEAIREADKESMKLFSGHGSAIAQSYNHIIMPLANWRDKETQIKWGIEDFRLHFNRDPEGMWLSETAVDTETLQIMVDNGIKYTILAPRQADSMRKMGDTKWTDVKNEKIDPRKAYIYDLGNGKSINLFFYDGVVAKDVAFNNLLSNGKDFADRLLSSLGDSNGEELLAHIATDGESYGHHHRHGDMALAFALNYIDEKSDASVTNYGEFLEMHPPKNEARIIEDTSWSCVHGVERWRSNCGCHTGGLPGWDQKWRKPLRDSLDWLRDILIKLYETEGKKVLKDPWAARNDYIDIILNRDSESVNKFLDKHSKDNSKIDRNGILRLLEMQRNAMLMYTSCGWFFNDISGIETEQILQYAARAIQLAYQLSGKEYEKDFVKILDEAQSNIEEEGTGGNLYEDRVIPSRLNLLRVGMHYAVASLFNPNPDELHIFNYEAKSEFFDYREAGIQRLVIGRTSITSLTTYTERNFVFAAIYLGQHNIIGNITHEMDEEAFQKMYDAVVKDFRDSNLSGLIGKMQEFFGPEKYSIWHLFKDEKLSVLNMITGEYLTKIKTELREIYNSDYQLINALKSEKITPPKIYIHAFEYVFNQDLMEVLQTEPLDTIKLKTIANKIIKWEVSIDPTIPYEKIITEIINKSLMRVYLGLDDKNDLKNINEIFEFLDLFNFRLVLYQSQNLYFKISRSKVVKSRSEEWMQDFNELGKNLGIKVFQAV